MRIEKRVEKEVGRLMLPDFQIYYKAATIKTHGERDAEINRRESGNRIRHTGQLLLNKSVQANQREKKSLFNRHCWSNWTSI